MIGLVVIAGAAICPLAFQAVPAGALARYKNDEGVIHWVNGIDKVPERYRTGAVGTPVIPAKPPRRSSRQQEHGEPAEQ